MVTLVLSGGGLWALAGIGAAAALRDMDVSVDGYVGSSAGAIVAALLASGRSPESLQQAALTLRPRDFRPDWKGWLGRAARGRLPLSVFSGDVLARRFKPFLRGQTWNTLPHPLWVAVTSLVRRQAIVYGSRPPIEPELGMDLHLSWGGTDIDLETALTASSAVPGIFPPVEVSGEVLVDGGVVDDYPVDVAAWVGARRIVGVWVDEKRDGPEFQRLNGGIVAMEAMTTMIRELTVIRQRQIAVPRDDVRIEIDGGHRVFHRIQDIIQKGYDLTWALGPQVDRAADQHA